MRPVKYALSGFSFSLEDARFLGEAEREDDTAILALQCLIGGVSIEECRAYWTLNKAFEHSKNDAARDFAALFKRTEHDYAKRIGAVRKHIPAYHKAFAALRQSPVAQAILDREFTENELMDAVRAQGIAIADDAEFYDNGAAYSLYEATVSFSHKMDSLLALETDSPLSCLENYLGALSALCRQDRKAAERFLDDLLLSVSRDSASMVFASLNEGNLGVAARLVVSLPEGSIQSLDAMAQVLPAYQAVASARLSNLLGKRFEFKYGSEQVRNIASGLEALLGGGVKAPEIGELVFSVGPEQQQDVLSLLSGNPAYARLWRTLRKAQTSVRKYADFLLSYAPVRTGAGAESCFEFVDRVASSPDGINTAKALIESGYVWALDTGVHTLLSTSTGHNPEILVRTYLRYGSEGAGNKQAAVLELSRAGVASERLKAIRQGLDRIANKELEGFLQNPFSITRLEQLLEQFIAGKHYPSAKAPSPAGQPDRWADMLLRSYPEHRLVIAEAYKVLESHQLEGRLRNMWATQPESVVMFASEVVAYQESAQLFMAMENPALYGYIKACLRRAPSESFGKEINAVAPNGNSYQALHEALIAAVALRQPAAAAGKAAEDNGEGEMAAPLHVLPLTSIIVWGNYSFDIQARIRQELPEADIRFYNKFRRAKFLPQDADAVLWETPGSEHSAYYAVKLTCSKRGVPFYHINQPGYEAVVSLVGKLTGL